VKNVLFVSGTYVAALIGAGLASGAETAMFFARYGKWGGLGVLVCSVIFSWFIYALFTGLKRTDTQNLNDYIKDVIPGAKSLCSFVVIMFLVCVYSAMIAGAGEIICNITGMNKLLAMLLFNLLCILIVILPISKIVKICGGLGIIIGVIIAIFSVRFAFQRGVEAFNITDNWLVSSVSYSGYNILSCIGILCPLVTLIKTRRGTIGVSVLSGVMIFLILICMWGAISIYYGKINLGVFPMLTLAKRQGEVWYYIYVVIFFLAILTTAISAAYGIYTSVCKVTRRAVSAAVVYIVSVTTALAGFELIVGTIYKICGIIGVVIPIAIITKELKVAKNGKKGAKKFEKKF